MGTALVAGWRAAERMGRLGALAALVACLAADPGSTAASSRPDSHVVALWLFDEPQYLNMTLTDASPHWHDLRLMDAGELVPGRFGGCLVPRAGTPGQTVCYAEERQCYVEDAPVLPLGRPAVPPARLLACLAAGDWTWEWWLRFQRDPEPGACLVDAGQDAFYCSITAQGNGLEVLSAGQGVRAALPVNMVRLGDGGWHHLALTWTKATRMLACFLDGQLQGARRSADQEAWARAPGPQYLPGLAGQIFASADLTRPAGTEVSPTLDFELGLRRGTGWSERWRGWLTGPVTGRVRFRAETDTGLRMTLGEATVIDSWMRDGPREGEVGLIEGERFPVVIEYTHVGQAARLRLLWSWQGQQEHLVPAGALSHTLQDEGKPAGAYRFDLALLSEQGGANRCDAQLDEMRFSDVVRYRDNFSVPGSFSGNLAPDGRRPAAPTGPPLLFAADSPRGVVDLGGRKHLFIDDALLESSEGLQIRQCPPLRIEQVKADFDLGDATVLDSDGQIRLYYGGWTDSLRLAVSEDGLSFKRPELGIAEWGGSKEGMGGNAVLRLPGQATIFVDGDPACPPDERYKATAFIMTRGLYALTSPDGIHWARGETIMLPFDCGGGVESYWDDQRGQYTCHIRHEGHLPREGIVRRLAARAETREFLKPWPYDPDPQPVPRGAFTLPALWRELPTPFVPDESGQVYRTRALKYEWAPDAYLAFVWRYDTEKQTRETELAVSRDGRRWRLFGCRPAYLPVGTTFGDGLSAKGALAAFGLVRRGDAIWQYAELNTAGHSAGQQAVVRATQRLDGFVCLQAGDQLGWGVTRPLRFEGEALELNVQAEGELRVGVLDEAGMSIHGFSVSDCEPIRGDAIRYTVRWRGGSLAALRGTPVRLRFEMRQARLFALQFVSGQQRR